MSRMIVLVSCVKRKRWQAKAKDLYDSTLFSAERAYAERFADAWYILSAKHYLLDPCRVIRRYNRTLNNVGVAKRRAWSAKVFAKLRRCTSPKDKIIIVAGKNYCQYLVPLIEERGNKVLRPTKGYSMGRIPGRLRRLMRRGIAPW